jgi:hypothetical protein
MAQTLGIRAYDADGNLVKDFDGTFDEEPEFYAHHLLHADGIVCVEVRVPDGEVEGGARMVLRQCDPGLDFDRVVNC